MSNLKVGDESSRFKRVFGDDYFGGTMVKEM